MTVRSPHQALNRKIRLALGCRNGHQPHRTKRLRDGQLCCLDCQRETVIAKRASDVLGHKITAQELRDQGSDFEAIRAALRLLPSSKKGSAIFFGTDGFNLANTAVVERDGGIFQKVAP